ncbi:MAG: TetR/AcrR family transcriptional regulator [Ornithinimicrobium sp.]
MTATPRQQARIAATHTIKRIARRQLAEGGAAALSLREIAKEMGLVSSAIYRYVPSRHALLTGLIADAYDRLGAAAETADATLEPEDLAGRWRALANALRDWARADPTDYTLVYGPPIPGYDAPPETYAPAQRWIEVFIDILARSDGAEAEPVNPVFLHQLARVRDERSPYAPLGGVAQGLAAWSQLHGLVSLEIYGQTAFVLGDATGLFEHCVERQIVDLRLAH